MLNSGMIPPGNSNIVHIFLLRSISPATPRVLSPITPGHTTIPKEGTRDALHLETPDGTAGDQYELLTGTVPAVHVPMMVAVRQDVTRTYGRKLRNSKTILAVIARKSLCFTEQVNKSIRLYHLLGPGWDGLWLCSGIAGILKLDTCLQKEPSKYREQIEAQTVYEEFWHRGHWCDGDVLNLWLCLWSDLHATISSQILNWKKWSNSLKPAGASIWLTQHPKSTMNAQVRKTFKNLEDWKTGNEVSA